MAFMDTQHTPAQDTSQDTAGSPADKDTPEITDAVRKSRGELVERLVAQSVKGAAPWNRKLDPAIGERLPYNPFSKTPQAGDALRGANGIQLASVAQDKGYKDPRWISRSQMQERGWSFKTGERGTNIEFYTPKGKERQQFRHDSQGNEMFDEDGNRLKETVKLDKATVGAVQMFNMEQVYEGKWAKTPIPELQNEPHQPDLAGLNQAFAKSGMEVQDARPDDPSHISIQGKGALYLSLGDKARELDKAQLMIRGMAAKALTLDTAGGWSQADSDRTKFIKTQLRVELATRVLSDKFAVPTRPERLNVLKEHVAEVLNTANAKTGERDQIRFAARDADRAITRVLEGNWERSQEWSRSQGQQQEQPEQSRQGQERQPEKPEPQAKAPARPRARGKVLERA
jgi:antirestriction protein ArdC